MNNKRYFEEAERAANENFLSANGFDKYENFIDDYDGFVEDDSYGYANGSAPVSSAPAPTSRPYIFSIANSTASDVSNVIFGDAYTNAADATNFGNPASITITSGVPNVTYKQFLFQTIAQPFTVGLTYVQSSNTSQILEILTLTHKDANGLRNDVPIIPVVDPYQQQTTVLVDKSVYRWDGYTYFTIANILANATAKLYLYPQEKVNLTRGLAGQSVALNYGNPGIVRTDKVQVVQPRRIG